MCRNQLVRAERCKCSYGARRSASDRAYYAATKAAKATPVPHPVFKIVAPAAPVTPAASDIRALADQVSAAYANASVTTPRSAPIAPRGEPSTVDGHESREAAIVAVGAQVAARAEMHAGITAEEARDAYLIREAAAQHDVDEALKVIEPLDNAHKDLRTEFYQIPMSDPRRGEVRAAREIAEQKYWAAVASTRSHEKKSHLNLVLAGRDQESLDDLGRLSRGYSQALAEVRDTGGQMAWNPKSTNGAKAVFDEASGVYPSEWIEKSNEGSAPLARISKSRAHYTGGIHKETKKRVQRSRASIYHAPPADSAYYTHTRSPNQDDTGESGVRYDMKSWELAASWTVPSDGSAPKGRGWERYDYGDRSGWRKPSMRMETIASEYTPEITTNTSATSLAGRSGTFATSVHEISHRMEATVPGIKTMEEDFLIRRTTTDGQRDSLKSLYAGRREYARPDNFVNAYMGKTYDDGSREVLSCGTEGLFGGNYGGLIGVGKHQTDHNYRSFILGVLASAGRTKS